MNNIDKNNNRKIIFFNSSEAQEEYHLRQTAFMNIIERIKLATTLSKMFFPDLWKNNFVSVKKIRFRPIDEY
ncbi:MAG: hypothetical protein JNL63_11440 [Bacteroidia bacterium]|nr:hypothetical protein [Bacteroidia bacterium]